MSVASRYLHPRAVRTLERMGELVCPGAAGLPAFSETGCIVHLDQILEVTPEPDVQDLNRLLRVMSLAPDTLLRALLKRAADAERMPAPIRPLMRQLDLGLRGILYSLYYSGKGVAGACSAVHEAMDYHISCKETIDERH